MCVKYFVWHESEVDSGPIGAHRLPYGGSHHRRCLGSLVISLLEGRRSERVQEVTFHPNLTNTEISFEMTNITLFTSAYLGPKFHCQS